MLFGHFFSGAIVVDSVSHPAMGHLAHHYEEFLHSPTGMALYGLMALPFILAASGVILAWIFYIKRPDIPAKIQQKFSGIYKILENKYGFDRFNERVFAGGARFIGNKLWQIGDVQIIDGAMVNGTANLVGRISAKVRHLQSGLIYHYAFAMIIGVFLFLTFFIKIN
jgi:NADH-quinone oxidoreductase subunit L